MAGEAAVERGAFVYANPPRVFWGAGSVVERLEGELARLGAGRALLVTTRSVAASPALGGALRARLGGRLLAPHVTIRAHAPVRDVAEAAALARDLGPDLLLSCGGGSPIDAAKAVAFALASGLDLLEKDAAKAARGLALAGRRVLPHLAIPTTLSAAEMGSGAGFTTEATRQKSGLFAPELLPAAIFYDADFAVETPLDLWLSTGIRAIDHAVETILAPESHPHADALALEALRRLPAALRAAKAAPADREARTRGQLGAWLSDPLPHESGAGLSHMLGKRIGARHGIPHGVTSCLLLPHVMRVRAREAPRAMARIAEALGAPDAADAVAALVAELDLPRHLGPFGLTDADLAEAVRPLAGEGRPAADLVAILRAAW
jgi:alcohol dehydrogenase class IV